MGREVTVRNYKPGDEEAILRLLERAFVWPASEVEVSRMDHWKWKYLDNPMGLLFIGLVEDAGELVCHSAALPFMIMIGGKSYRGVEGSDVCRNKDRADEEMILNAIRSKYAVIDRNGIDFCFSFPVQDMYYNLLRKFDYIDTGLETERFVLVLQPEKFFAAVGEGSLKKIAYRLLTTGKENTRRSAIEASSEIRVEDADDFGPDIEQLFLSAAGQFDIIIVRSRERMNWRYADRRGGRYHIRVARKGGKLAGYAVLKFSGTGDAKSCEVADMLAHPDHPDALDVLVCDSAKYAEGFGAISLSCRLLNNHPYIPAVRRMGFVKVRNPSGAHWVKLTVRNQRKKSEIDSVLKKGDLRVHIMVGDTDGI